MASQLRRGGADYHACEFRARYHKEAADKDDLSLLRGIGEAEVAKYARRGILTVAHLAGTFRPPGRAKKLEQRKPAHSYPLQALSLQEKKVHVLGAPTLPASAARIYFDVEGDPDRGFDYLIGVVVRGPGALAQLRAPGQEPRAQAAPPRAGPAHRLKDCGAVCGVAYSSSASACAYGGRPRSAAGGSHEFCNEAMEIVLMSKPDQTRAGQSSLTCPRCKAALQATVEKVGQKVRCPHCSAVSSVRATLPAAAGTNGETVSLPPVDAGRQGQEGAGAQTMEQVTQPPAADPLETTAEGVAWRDGLPTVLPASLGRYQLIEQLGKGGMGAVYLAQDTQLQRRVALKIPLFSPANETLRERFFREARAAAALAHPNLCPVHDVGEIGGVSFLTMAFIEGKPLSHFVGQPLAERTVVVLVRQLALALEEAHRHGIIHRDLKPANIMINTRKQPVIMDFGLAHLAASTEDHTRLTQRGTLMGTPAYMPPEQINGDVEAMGPCCDIYSLGVILYELLTGRVPFDGPLGVLVSRVVNDPPPPPHTFHPNLDPALEAVCLLALAKRPQDRYATMKDFAAALEGCLRGAPLSAPRKATPSAPQPAVPLQATLFEGLSEPTSVRPSRAVTPKHSPFGAALRRPYLLTAAGLLALAGAVALTVCLWPSHPKSVAKHAGSPSVVEPPAGVPAGAGKGEKPKQPRKPKKEGVVEDGQQPTRPRPVPQLDPPGKIPDRAKTSPPVDNPPAKVEPPQPGPKPPLPVAKPPGPPNPPPPPVAGLVRTFVGHQKPVHSVCPAADGTWFASAGDDRTVRRWDVKTGRQLALFEHTDPVLDVTVDFLMKRVASATAKQVAVWDVKTQKQLWHRPAPRKALPLTLISSGDSKSLVVFLRTGWIRTWNADTALYKDRLIFSRPVKSMSLDQKGLYTATAGEDGSLYLIEAGKSPVTFRDLCPADIITFNPTGDLLASAGSDGKVHLWSVPDAKEVATGLGRRSPVRCLMFSFKDNFNQFGNEGRWLASAHEDGAVTLWEVEAARGEVRLKERVTYDAHRGGVACALYMPDNRSLLSCGRDGTIKLWAVPHK